MEKANYRTHILTQHLLPTTDHGQSAVDGISAYPCFSYDLPELSSQPSSFDVNAMRKLMDVHNIQDRDWLFNLMAQSNLFNPRMRGGKVFVVPDYNQSMEQQREITMKRIQFLSEHGVFDGWLTVGEEAEFRKIAFMEVMGTFDHSLSVKTSVHFSLWYVLLSLSTCSFTILLIAVDIKVVKVGRS